MTGSAWDVVWEGDPSPDYRGYKPLPQLKPIFLLKYISQWTTIDDQQSMELDYRIRRRSYCGVFCFSISVLVI